MVAEIYEHWTPQPGDRVRVRISAECRVKVDYCTGIAGPNGFSGIYRLGHDPVEDGAIGTVDYLEPAGCCAPQMRGKHPGCGDPARLAWCAHRVMVEFDEPIPVAIVDYPQTCQYFAVAELEPLH